MTINSTKVLGGLIALVGAFTFATTSASADEVQHTVKSGDTVSQIAVDYDASIDEIETSNQIDQNTDLIYEGQVLNVNSTVSTAPQEVAVVEPVAVQTVATQEPTTAPVAQAPVAEATPVVSGGSTYAQFIQAGGTDAMWNAIVLLESSGNPNASNGQYHGLGQTNQSWGYGSVAEQTQGMLNYATSRYGSVDNAISARAVLGYW